MKKTFRTVTVLVLALAMLSAAALASGQHDCVDVDNDHFCDECWESVTLHCTDADADHICDVCGYSVRTDCTDADGDRWCDLCWAHLPQYCADDDKNHVCDLCWTVMSTCMDENKDHLCDLCGGVFWVDGNGDGVCDGCDAVLTHVTADHIGIYYHERNGAVLADVVIEVMVHIHPDMTELGYPAGTVSVSWTDEDGNAYTTVEKALTFDQSSTVLEFPSLPLSALNGGGRVVFRPYDAGFTPAENGCAPEFDLAALRVDSDSGFTVNGVSENLLYVVPGSDVVVRLQPGSIERWVWYFEEGYAVPEVTVDGLVTTFTMPEEDVNMYAQWRCEVCTDADGDTWCDLCDYGIEVCPSAGYTDVPADAWYHAAVDHALKYELMRPAGETAFAPGETATRADFVYALWKLEGEPLVDDPMTFSDVDQEQWYAEAVRWGAAMGVVRGYPDGSFRPDETVTREQMAAFLYRYLQMQGDGFTGAWMFLLDYTDRADVAEWAYEPLCWLTMNGLVQGDGTGALRPKATTTRAEMAQVLMNYMGG